MDPSVPVWLLLLVYKMFMSCMVCGEKEGLMNTEFRPAEEETDCNITINHKSAENLMVKFSQFDPDVAYFTLKFPNNSVVRFNEHAIQPFRWIWTFEGKDRTLPFLGWDLDHAILSLGLLQEKTLQESWVEIDVQPPNCSIMIGTRKTNLEIAYAFSNMTNVFLHSVGLMYNNHYADTKNHSFCFASEIPGVKDTFLYKYGTHYVYPVDFTQYNCCFSYYDFVKEEIIVNCSDHQTDMEKGYTPGPYIVIFIIFCCAPIFLLDLVSNMSGKEVEGDSGLMQFRNGYISLDDMENNENVNYDVNLTSDFVYLTKHSPISLSVIISERFFRSKRRPLVASRLRRILFILFCPILVYIQLGIYGIQMKETTLELIKHGAPIHFLTMLGEPERSRELFVPYLGGPYVLIILFHILGIVFLVFPENLEKLYENVCPTVYGYDLVKRFSHVRIDEERGYGRLRLLMIARILCILNPAFWKHLGHTYLARCKQCLTCIRNRLPALLFYLLFLISVPILFLAFIVAVFIIFVYYGTPWFCLLYHLKWFENLWMKRDRDKFDYNFKNYSRCCVVVVYFILFLFSMYFTYSMVLIIGHGVFLMTRVIIYLFTAIFVYPSVAFTYVFFFASMFHYFLKQIGGISDDYLDLLSDIVKSLKLLETDPNQLRVVGNTLFVPNGQNGTIRKIHINGTTIKLSEEQLQSIRTSSTNVNDGLLRYKNEVPGIPRELFIYVVRKHKPVFVAVSKALFPIVLFGISIPPVIRFISYTSHDSSQVTEVMKAVFIGFLPRMLEMAFSGSNKAVFKEIFLHQLQTSILEYKRLVQT